MTYDVVIIGAGIVRQATAYQLKKQQAKLQACVSNKESASTSYQTGHNSDVIHSGIFYKPGRLKTQNCRKVKVVKVKVYKVKGAALSIAEGLKYTRLKALP